MRHLVARSLLVLMVLAGALLLAFGPRPVSHAPADRVRVQYWEKWTGLEGQQAKEIVDAFNNTVGAEKGIWVDYVSMSQIDRKTLVSTAAGAPPDVVGLWDSQAMQFASLGALEPLDDYAKQYGLSRDLYKPVYYDGCVYKGRLYALPSTAWCVGMLWNKEIFEQKADALRAAGCDPTRPPRTIAELDRYAVALDSWEQIGGRRRLAMAGYIPLEPGYWLALYPMWFGAHIANDAGTRVLLDSPQMIAAWDWVRSYTERIGRNEMAEFRSGFNSGGTNLYDTPQNPFLVGMIAMEQQGPWVTAFIEKLKPEGNRWHVPPDQLKREKDFANVVEGMARADVEALLGRPADVATASTKPPAVPGGSELLYWPAGIKDLYVTVANGKVAAAHAVLLPAKLRQKYCKWGATAFPSAVPGMDNVTYAGMDIWVIPSTSKHKKEAMEFLAFASRQDQIEKLSALHCNLSPLRNESREYLDTHPNPYVDVFEAMAASPNAQPLPKLVNWPFVSDELRQVGEKAYMLEGDDRTNADLAQARAQADLNKELGVSSGDIAGAKGDK